MNRPMVPSSCDQFLPHHLYSHTIDEQNFRLDTSNFHSAQRFPTNHFDKNSGFSTIHRHLSTPTYDQFHEEEQPLRVHVGNIPFLWTIDDLRKQFLVFGPVKDPEIVSNERGSKGFGFITFLRHTDGMNAIRVKNGSIADGRKITVALASSRSSSRIVANSSHYVHCCCCNKNSC